MGSTRYITSMGELSRKDNSLCFRKDGKNVYIPIENTKEIYCLNEISINTKLLDFLARNDIVVHFFNYFEGYSGTFYPRNKYNSGKLLVKQVEKYENSEERLKNTIQDSLEMPLNPVHSHGTNRNIKNIVTKKNGIVTLSSFYLVLLWPHAKGISE
mgnify:CR=1 FL=1